MSQPPPLSLDHHIFISNNSKNNHTLDSGSIDLLLGLALHAPTVTHDYRQQHQQQQPSLTLSMLFPDTTQQQNLSSNCSSFSNSFVSVKRERDDQGVTAVINDVYEDDTGGSSSGGNTPRTKKKKKKLRLNKQQSALLEDSFKLHTTLNPKQKEDLARQLNLRPRQVEVWFQNRRARTKLKQTEVDCEFMKKCCERLAKENEKLHKELQHLKSLKKLQQQPYMPHLLQLQPNTTTADYMHYCPSCHHHQQVQVPTKNTSNNFLMSSKKRIVFNPFTEAC